MACGCGPVAGASSFRRAETVAGGLQQAEQPVQQLKAAGAAEDAPARERLERAQQAVQGAYSVGCNGNHTVN